MNCKEIPYVTIDEKDTKNNYNEIISTSETISVCTNIPKVSFYHRERDDQRPGTSNQGGCWEEPHVIFQGLSSGIL